jgi:hypothetical protein
MRHCFLVLLVFIFCSACRRETSSPEPLPVLSSNAPPDRPLDTTGKAEVEKALAALAPYIEQARQTYPAAKKRYLENLPAGHHFFVVTRLRDKTGTQEQVFVAVSEIRNGRISGRIASDVLGVSGFRRGDSHSFPEHELIDWLITRPDGTEEGNVVGKFLDTYQRAP